MYSYNTQQECRRSLTPHLCVCFFGCQEQLEASIKLLEDFKSGNLPAGVTNKQLWEAQKIKQVKYTWVEHKQVEYKV